MARLSHGTAVLIGVAAVFGGVAVYEIMQRAVAPRAPRLATTLLLAAFVAIVYALTHLLNGRAAFLHVGAMLGSIMAGNVAMTIIPSQRELVRSVSGEGRANPAISARAKRVSITNNYVTFPVIVLMVSSHFPSLYSHRWSWLLLLVLVGCGAAVRHLMNVRYTFRVWKPVLAGVVVATVVVLWSVLANAPAQQSTTRALPGTVTFADARHVIDRRCAACHSVAPSDSSFGAAPAGVAFDREVQPFVIALQSMTAPSARLTAAKGLAEGRHCSSEGVKGVLFQAAQMDPCGEVRAACIDHLCKLGYYSPQFLGHIQVACEDTDPQVRDAAKAACAKMLRK